MPDQNTPIPRDPHDAAETGTAGDLSAGLTDIITPDAHDPVGAGGGLPTREHAIGQGITWLSRWSGRWILIAIAAWIVGQIVSWTWSILMPIALGLVIATALAPIARGLREKLRFSAGAAAGVTMLGAIGVLVWVGFMVVPSVANDTSQIAKDAAAGIQHLQEWAADSRYLSSDQLDDLLSTMQQKLTESATDIASGVLTGVSAATSVVVTMVTALILTFLFVKDGDRFVPWVRRVSGASAGRHLAEVMVRSWQTLGGFIRTQALVSMIDAIFIGIGLVIIGVPMAAPLAVITFFAGFIPIVGAFGAGAIAVLVALVSNGITGALWTLLVIVLVQQLEGNVLSPMLQSKSMNLHASVVLLSVALGGGLFGIPGAFLAVPVVAVIAVMLRYLDEQVSIATGEVRPVPPPPEPRGPSWLQKLTARLRQRTEHATADEAA